MKPFPIPVVALGPGSQPVEEPLNYIASPGEMAVFRTPTPRVAASPAVQSAACEFLGGLLEHMGEGVGPVQPVRLSMLGLTAEVCEEINELLGRGEVSVLLAPPRTVRIQESAFPGIWRIQEFDTAGALQVDDVEVGPMPALVHAALAVLVAPRYPPAAVPDGVMNAPALLEELRVASGTCRRGDEAHIINLTLLPVTPEDLQWLAGELGWGPVSILSRGYGNCRVTATGLPHTWWVQYFNSTDQLILNTLEVVDMPVVAVAAEEDLLESAARLREWLRTVQ